MKEISISKFKAQCLAIVDQVDKTREPVIITKFGTPIAEVIPVVKPNEGSWLGCMKERGRLEGDLVEIDTSDQWDALKE